MPEKYLALWAFGYRFLRRAESEGFYRMLSTLVLETPLTRDGNHTIVDVGCGVGRTVADLARHYPSAIVTGVDFSQRMLEHACRMVIGDPPGSIVEVGLEPEGFGRVSASSFNFSNVFFAQASALNLPFADSSVDVVTSSNVIDRVLDPRRMLRELHRILKPGSYLVLADALNWHRTPDWWDKARTLEQVSRLLEEVGFEVELSLDGLIYREIIDVRGAYTEWRVGVVRAVRDGHCIARGYTAAL